MKQTSKKVTVLVLTMLFFKAGHTQQTQADTSTVQDKKTIDACIQTFYRVLSYQANKLEKLDSLTQLFVPDGTLTAAFGQKPLLWTAPQFVAFIKNGAAQGATDRAETEVQEHTDLFGNMAHRFSTYSLKVTLNGKPQERRGINSIQLIRQEGRWLIHSLVWDRENDSLKIPKAYGGQ